MEELNDYKEDLNVMVEGIGINLDISDGEWFDFFGSYVDSKTGDVVYDDPNPAAKVLIRSAAPFVEAQLKKRKRKTEYVHNPKTRSMERVSGFEELTTDQMFAEADAVYDYAILDFKGFHDSKTKQPLECTKETKVKMRHNQVFARFFERCQQILNGNVEAIEKN